MALSQAGYGSDPALANLELLRQRLREALYAKKTRLRELAELCKRQRAELRTWVKQRREYAVAELRAELRAARSAAQANRRSRLQDARRSSVSAVELARAGDGVPTPPTSTASPARTRPSASPSIRPTRGRSRRT